MSGGHYDQNDIIRAKNLQQVFDVGDEKITALQEASFSLKANSFNIIYGASGSGKSTLLNILAGIQAPTTGSLQVQDRNIYDMSSDELAHFRANQIGFIHQSTYWIKSLNVIENISVPLFFLGYGRPKAEKLAMTSLERVGMADYAKKDPVLLSGGEQQRLAAARALANDPLFIIADEPTGNLDTESGDQIMNMLLNAQNEFRRTVILVTHNMEYLSLADHLLKIQDGVLEDIQSEDIDQVVDNLMEDVRGRLSDLGKLKKHATEVK